MNYISLGLFLLTATALLGSPGPGIAALLVIGRAHGWGGLRFYVGLQVGLAMAFGTTAIGLLSLLAALPVALSVMTYASIAYLIYLAYQIATSPVEPGRQRVQSRASALSGFLLGIANPKAYIAFASLLASQTLVAYDLRVDALFKWTICVVVAVVVDIVWLFIGVKLQHAALKPFTERVLNILLATTILTTAVMTLL